MEGQIAASDHHRNRVMQLLQQLHARVADLEPRAASSAGELAQLRETAQQASQLQQRLDDIDAERARCLEQWSCEELGDGFALFQT